MSELETAIKAVRHYAETHPRPVQVTQTQAADMLGISSKTVSRMIKSGQIILNGCGLIPISEIDRVLQKVA